GVSISSADQPGEVSKISEVIVVRFSHRCRISWHRNGATSGDSRRHFRQESRGRNLWRTYSCRVATYELAQLRHLILERLRLRIEFFSGAGAFLRAGGIAL